MKEYLYSEIFYSPQGEGYYTGVPTVWVRFFLCNLQCDGFGQDDPTDPSTYELPYKDFDLIPIKNVEELPVFEKGCDSSYSWAKRYKHLAKKGNAVQICDQIENAIRSKTNPEGLFLHPNSGEYIHLAFTGGEPMLHQDAMEEVIAELKKRNNQPLFVTIETNGTQPLTQTFKDNVLDCLGTLVFMSVSPKLFNVSGEKAKHAIKPEVIGEYSAYATGQLKFVLNGNDAAWDEFEQVLSMIRDEDCEYPVWIMPVGATDSGQAKSAAAVARRAIADGYNVSARAHLQIFGNVVGS